MLLRTLHRRGRRLLATPTSHDPRELGAGLVALAGRFQGERARERRIGVAGLGEERERLGAVAGVGEGTADVAPLAVAHLCARSGRERLLRVLPVTDPRVGGAPKRPRLAR